jgi:hypothetical protein
MMRRAIQICFVLMVCVTAATAAPPADAEASHEIKLNRPMKVGQKFDLKAECMIVQKSGGTIMGSAVGAETTRYIVRLDSELEIVDVDKHGRATETEQVIRSCVISKNGQVIRDEKAGTRLRAWRRGEDKGIEVDGVAVADETAGVLEMVCCLEHDGATDDELYGSSEPRKVGETWPIEHDAVLADFQRQTSTPIQSKQLSGEMKLLEALERDGEPCLKVFNRMKLDDAILGLGPMPPGATLEEASTDIKIQGVFPRDATKTWRSRSAQIELHLVMVQPGAGTLRSDTSVVLNLELTPGDSGEVATVTEAESR